MRKTELVDEAVYCNPSLVSYAKSKRFAVYAKEVCFGTVFHLKHRADTSSFHKTIKSLQN